MKDLSTVEHNPSVEELVSVLCRKTQSKNEAFFRVLIVYYYGKLASMMRAYVATLDRGDIPINIYAINLASSGEGKGFSKNILEENIINGFQDRFINETLPILAEENLVKLATKRALKKSTDQDTELVKVTNEFEALGNLAFSFDSGTTAAVKQMRHKLLMADAGSVNMEIDEIGSNLLGNTEVLTSFLELYDVGKIKQKLTKNTAENVRSEEIDGRTPTNMLLFGTPSKLFNGGKVEEEFWSMQETGFGRRCIFGFVEPGQKDLTMTPEELFDRLTTGNSDELMQEFSEHLTNLADIVNFQKRIEVSKEVTLIYLEYKLLCERKAQTLADHEEITKAELSHRYFKALKIAGAYAFIEDTFEITEEQMYAAIKLVEESGDAFRKMNNRDRNYVKLAKYIASVNRTVTHVDLVEDLPFYKGGESQKRDLMTLAVAWAYQNNIIIKKSFIDGIEFLHGETLKETDLDDMILSYSTDYAYDYASDEDPIAFDDLHHLTQEADMHWINHEVLDGHRTEENCIPGFNMVCIDVDGGVSLDMATKLLADYKFHAYTTKRHTEENNRFRIIIPTNFVLKLDAVDYKEFMNNVYDWLPFDVDADTNQRSKKWLSHDHHYVNNDGELLDVLPFIPKTPKNEERKKQVLDMASLSNLERWFLNNTGDGNRNKQMIRYALIQVDMGMTFEQVRDSLLALNNKLPNKLTETEILSTIMVSVSKAIARRNP